MISRDLGSMPSKVTPSEASRSAPARTIRPFIEARAGFPWKTPLIRMASANATKVAETSGELPIARAAVEPGACEVVWDASAGPAPLAPPAESTSLSSASSRLVTLRAAWMRRPACDAGVVAWAPCCAGLGCEWRLAADADVWDAPAAVTGEERGMAISAFFATADRGLRRS